MQDLNNKENNCPEGKNQQMAGGQVSDFPWLNWETSINRATDNGWQNKFRSISITCGFHSAEKQRSKRNQSVGMGLMQSAGISL